MVVKPVKKSTELYSGLQIQAFGALSYKYVFKLYGVSRLVNYFLEEDSYLGILGENVELKTFWKIV